MTTDFSQHSTSGTPTDQLVHELVPDSSVVKKLLVSVFVIVVVLATIVVPSASFNQEWNEWRNVGELTGKVAFVEDAPVKSGYHAALVMLDDGRVFTWGGKGTSNNSGAIYDAKSGKWEDVPPAPGEFGRFTTAHVWTGEEVFIWGGHTNPSNFNYDPGGLAYNPTSKTWRELPEAPVGMQVSSSIAVDGGVLVAGAWGVPGSWSGSDPNLWFDLADNTWSRLDADFVAANIVEIDGRIWAAGPSEVGFGRAGPDWAVHEFDPNSKTWDRLTEPLAAEWMVVVPVSGGGISVISKQGLNQPLEALLWDDGVWQQLAWSHESAKYISSLDKLFLAPVSVWTGRELIMGGEFGLLSWDPSKGRFAYMEDRTLGSHGQALVWTGGEVVSLSGDVSPGFTWTPPRNG